MHNAMEGLIVFSPQQVREIALEFERVMSGETTSQSSERHAVVDSKFKCKRSLALNSAGFIRLVRFVYSSSQSAEFGNFNDVLVRYPECLLSRMWRIYDEDRLLDNGS